MSKFATSSITSQIGARWRISLCVRTLAMSQRLQISFNRKGNENTPEVGLLHAAGHRVFPLNTLEQVKIGEHLARSQHDRREWIVRE